MLRSRWTLMKLMAEVKVWPDKLTIFISVGCGYSDRETCCAPTVEVCQARGRIMQWSTEVVRLHWHGPAVTNAGQRVPRGRNYLLERYSKPTTKASQCQPFSKIARVSANHPCTWRATPRDHSLWMLFSVHPNSPVQIHYYSNFCLELQDSSCRYCHHQL